MSAKLETPEVIGRWFRLRDCDECPHDKIVGIVLDPYECERCIADLIRADRQAVLEQAAKLALSVYSCSCDAAYTDRKMTAPDCFHCNALEDAAEAIRAFARELAGTAEGGK